MLIVMCIYMGGIEVYGGRVPPGCG